MMKPLWLSLTAALAFLGFRDLYCPECERFSADDWAIDARGLCRGCGRRPVVVEAAAREWFWCETHEEWRDDPCSQDRTRRCCASWRATTLVHIPAGAAIGRHPFCPQCRVFKGFEAGRDGRDHCVGCGKAAAEADAADLVWYWCRGEERWGAEPCDRDRAGKCCSPRSVRMPVSWIVPKPWPTSFPREEAEPVVTTDWLAAHADDLNLVLVHAEFGRDAADALTRPTFDEGHIPFAHPLEWRATATARDELPNEFPPASEMAEAFRRIGVDDGSRVVLYDTGSGLEAARAFVALEYLGLSGRVSLLDGQWKKWVREGRELSRVRSDVEPSAFVPQIRSEVLVDRRAVRDVVWTALEPVPTAILIDARPADEYSGATPGRGIKRPGHLPGAMSLPWTATLVSLENPVLRPEAELRALFESKGARPGRRVLLYCRSGVDAALGYVVARSLGYAVSFYDGSYAEWSQHPDLPVETNLTMLRR